MGGGEVGEKSGLRSSPSPPREARNFFLLNGPGIALMVSLQINTGSGLG